MGELARAQTTRSTCPPPLSALYARYFVLHQQIETETNSANSTAAHARATERGASEAACRADGPSPGEVQTAVHNGVSACDV